LISKQLSVEPIEIKNENISSKVWPKSPLNLSPVGSNSSRNSSKTDDRGLFVFLIFLYRSLT
jgi:hypothetical protein